MPDNPLPDVSFEGRAAQDGVYDTCFRDFTQGSDSLSQLDINEGFFHETNDWPPDRFVTRFYPATNADSDLTVTLFGEVLDESDGTGLGARGGSSVKRTDVSLLTSCWQYHVY